MKKDPHKIYIKFPGYDCMAYLQLTFKNVLFGRSEVRFTEDLLEIFGIENLLDIEKNILKREIQRFIDGWKAARDYLSIY